MENLFNYEITYGLDLYKFIDEDFDEMDIVENIDNDLKKIIQNQFDKYNNFKFDYFGYLPETLMDYDLEYVKTYLSFNNNDITIKLTFSFNEKLNENEIKDLENIDCEFALDLTSLYFETPDLKYVFMEPYNMDNILSWYGLGFK